MKKNSPQHKLKRKALIIRIFGFLFIAFQLLGYIGSPNTRTKEMDIPETIGYFIGYNFFIWLAIIFFYWSWKESKKAKKMNAASVIEAIGEQESTL